MAGSGGRPCVWTPKSGNPREFQDFKKKIQVFHSFCSIAGPETRGPGPAFVKIFLSSFGEKNS